MHTDSWRFARYFRSAGLAATLLCVVGTLLSPNAASAADPIQTSAVGAADDHSCAIETSGQAVCWGENFDGSTAAFTPEALSGLTDGTAISVAEEHACALRASGQAVCWGYNEVEWGGEIGDGTETYRQTPTAVSGLSDATAITAGGSHSCAIRSGGQALCWGQNGEGQLGDGTETKRLTPALVSGLSDATAIAAGQGHTCAIRSSHATVCWGDNFNGDVGDGTETKRLTPTAVGAPSPSVKLWLTLTGEGLGEVIASPATDPCIKVPGLPSVICQYEFTPGTPLVLSASAADGSSFAGWGGDCTGPVCEVTITGEDHITGEFDLLTTTPPSDNGGGSSTLTASGSLSGGGNPASQPSGASGSGGQKPSAAECVGKVKTTYKKAAKAASHKKGKARAKALTAAKTKKAKRIAACPK